MSGGSYEYMCFAEVEDLAHKKRLIDNMAERLKELGYEDAAVATTGIYTAVNESLRILQEMKENIAGVWQAVEWLDSNDWGEESVKNAVEEWRQKTYNKK